ncbi:MAG: four helix bundle protein [Bacteroidota bacterium]
MGTYKDLQVYQLSFHLALDIHFQSLRFPKHELFALADQIRRSSRSTCANIFEAYRKRSYPKHFISKLSDADGENTETCVWLDFAISFGYIEKASYDKMKSSCNSIGNFIGYMMKHPSRFCQPLIANR